jgi:CheY-like chemotaxis protein
VARILYVEDEPAWLDLTRNALVGHQVDSARSFSEAVTLIQESPPYDLALVDLNLEEGDDRLGGEILDMLRMDYPSTRLIVVTGRPPIGGLRANIFERYGVEEIIIKGSATLPDLRRIVTEILRADSSVDITQDVKTDKSALAQRYRDWHRHVESIIRTEIREAQDVASGVEKKRGKQGRMTATDQNLWLLLREEFVRMSYDFERTLSDATSIPDIAEATDKLDIMINKFSGGIGRITPGE